MQKITSKPIPKSKPLKKHTHISYYSMNTITKLIHFRNYFEMFCFYVYKISIKES